MRDGAKLYTVLIIPKGVRASARSCSTARPIRRTRRPGAASGRSPRTSCRSLMPSWSAPATSSPSRTSAANIKSEGDYVMNRPLRGPLNPTAVDHSTDAWDTIDWLVKNVPESNGRVGTIGTSYDGFTALMSLVNPHPALKASVPINPMVDVWKGDDWFHNGAFRQEMISYVYGQTADRGSPTRNGSPAATTIIRPSSRYGSAGAYGQAMGMDQLPFWVRLTQHPAYDEYLAGPGGRPDPRPRAAHRPDPARRQRVGPGGHLRRPGRCSTRSRRAPTPTSCSARGTTARPTAPAFALGPIDWGSDTGQVVPRERHDPVPRPVSEGRPARRHRPGHRVRGRHQPVAAPRRLAAGLRPRLPGEPDPALSRAGPPRRLRRARRRAPPTATSPTPPGRSPTAPRPNLSPWADGLDLAHLAGRRPALRRGAAPTSSLTRARR